MISINETTAVAILTKYAQGNDELERTMRARAAKILGVIVLDDYRRAKYKTSAN